MKVLGWIIGLVLLLIVGIGVYVVMNSGALLEQAIETYGSRYLQAPVTVSGVNVSLSDGTAGISGLEIGNPEGFSGPPAFRLADISVALDTGQISSDLIVLKSVIVDGAQVAALVRGRDMNLQKLMDNLNQQIGASEQTEPEQTGEPGTESEVKLIIDRFSFTNANASVDSDLLGEGQVDIPDINLTGIGRKTDGATVGEALKQILEPIYRAVSRKLVEEGVDLDGARDKLEQKLRDKASEKLGGQLDSLTGKLRPKD
jgi:hypothetical protein